jgi:hypothetical protein
MRFVVVILALAACQRAVAPPQPAAPAANKVSAPDYREVANDELAFLMPDADFIIGVNAVELRKSQLWRALKPQIEAFTRQVQQQFASCGGDLTETIEGMTFALRLGDRERITAVIHGAAMVRTFDCIVSELPRQGGKVTVDRGVAMIQPAESTATTAALTTIGDTTLVLQVEPGPNHDTMFAMLDRGAPLRTSPTFMAMFNRRERGTSIWGVAVGDGARFGRVPDVRPLSIDGTIVVTDRVKIALRATMQSPDDAAKLQREFDKATFQTSAFVDRFAVQASAMLVTVDVEITETQLRALWAMVGVALGRPPP